MIPESTPRGKPFLNRLIVPLIVVLVGIAAFGLGRLSALKELQTGIVVHPASEAAN